MTAVNEQRAMELFDQLVELDPVERAAVLAQHRDDAALVQRVETLLAADAHAQGILEKDADEHFVDLVQVDVPQPKDPEQVGRYRIVERLGQGGMATVYRAERIDPDFEQTVALKLILPSRQSPHWQERFIQERQILATLQHRNIAVLLDGGVSSDGQPYFAMEYVAGVPITHYCDAHVLGLNERLRLLLAVCDAVSYAHSKLIVHRDLKPSNILVDADGQPKLLDFGIAKILSEEVTSRTQTVMRVLTPDYAAPEQFVGGPVTTVVDVYALGGLLFELLSGRRPFARASGSALDIEREIRERGAPTFARAANEVVASEREPIAATRGLSWRRLQRAIHGDLENIALKALRSEPERRYASVEAFAADIRRYLDGLPVQARADTLGYRLRKFVSRHPVGMPLGLVAIAGLVATSGIAIYQASQAETAAAIARLEAAKANETRDFVTSLFEFAGPDKSLGDQLTARQLLDLGATRIDQQLAGQPELHADMALLLANTYGQLGLYDNALSLAQQSADLFASIDETPRELDALLTVARLHRQTGNFERSAEIINEAVSLLGAALPAAHSMLLVERGELYREQAQFDQSRAAFEEALAIDRGRLAPPEDIARDLYRLGTLEFSAGDNTLGLDLLRQAAARLSDSGRENSTQFASIEHDIGVMLIQRGELAEALQVLDAVRETRSRLLGSQHPDLAVTLKELAGIARQSGENEEAERLYLEALAINEAMLGSEHPETSNNLNSLAVFYRGIGDDVRALEFAQRALAGAVTAYGPQHPTVGLMTVNVGSMQRMLGQLDDALESTTEGLTILVGALGEQHQLSGVAYNAMAGVQHDRSDIETAEINYRKALEIFAATAGDNHPHIVSILNGLATLLVETGRLVEAGQEFDKAAEIGKRALPPNHPNFATVQLGRARVAAMSGRCDEARRLYDEFGPIVAAAGGATRSPAESEVFSSCR